MKKLLLILICLPMFGFGQSPIERLRNSAMDAYSKKDYRLFAERMAEVLNLEVESENYYFNTTDNRKFYHANPLTMYWVAMGQFKLEMYEGAVQTTDFIIEYDIDAKADDFLLYNIDSKTYGFLGRTYYLNGYARFSLARADSDSEPETWFAICKSFYTACKLEYMPACQSLSEVEVCELLTEGND